MLNSSCKKSVLLSDPSSSEDNCLNDAAILGTRMASSLDRSHTKEISHSTQEVEKVRCY